jgi:hypothetical protein
MMRGTNRSEAFRSATPPNAVEVFVPQPLHFRLADSSDVTTLFDIRQAAIRQLSLTHLSDLRGGGLGGARRHSTRGEGHREG